MDQRYYQLLRTASEEEFQQGITNPEDELYDIVWDLFETVVVEPGEVFDPEFREHNQFRYFINGGASLEFFPEASYFKRRVEPDPNREDGQSAGLHLTFSILPYMSCLFSVGLHVWGAGERMAFKKLWKQHRKLLTDLLRCAKPMFFTAVPFPSVDHADSVEEMLDSYFAVRDPENSIELQYSFAQFDDTDTAQNFMIYMALLYHSIRDYCCKKENLLEFRLGHMKEFFSGRLPELPAPLPCVELAITSDTE